MVLFATGCLSPGRSPYDRLDDQAPTIVSIDPAMGGDAGVPTIRGGQIITITFDEQMNVDSLRPGIVVRNKDRRELPLSILLESEPTPISYMAGLDAGPNNIPMAVQVSSAEGGFERGSYQLILRTLLIDRAGNSISSEFLGAFIVGF
jgi:hypothetical protein